jgi:DNA-directed RNA polymerase specialized sigma24 family protein
LNSDIFNQEIYSRTFSIVSNYVLRNSGTMADVEDTLQEGLYIFFKNVKSSNFTLTTSPELYIFKVCSKLWLKELSRRKQIANRDVQFELKQGFTNNSIDNKARRDGLLTIVDNNIKMLSLRCQEIFRYKKQGLTGEEISKKMGFKNITNAKDKSFRCKKRLMQLINQDPEYQKLMNGE